MPIDQHGRAHRPAGSPASTGGQFAWAAGYLAGFATPVGIALVVLAVLAWRDLVARLRCSNSWCNVCEWQGRDSDPVLRRLFSTFWHRRITWRRRWHREAWQVCRWRGGVHRNPLRGESVAVDCRSPGCARSDGRSGWIFVDRDIAIAMAKRHDRVMHRGEPHATVNRELVGA